jgi:tRNA(Ile)-lysidine synthase
MLAAASGGLDSTALVHLLARLAPGSRWSLAVGHVHHGLRPEADAEAVFVRRLAESLGLRYLERRVGERIAQLPGRSLETRARRARMEALEEMREEAGAEVIVLAHTAQDQAETVLLNILRGAGPRGLAALRDRRGRLVRPLLPFAREEILAYARRRGLTWCVDRSNWSADPVRNRVRHELLPFLERRFQPQVRRVLARGAEATARWMEALEEEARRWLRERASREAGGIHLPGDVPPWLLPFLLQEAWGELVDRSRCAGLEAVHLRPILEAVSAGQATCVTLPGGIRARVHRRRIFLETEDAAEEAPAPLPGRFGDWVFSLSEVPPQQARREIAQRRGGGQEGVPREFFDADALQGPLRVRGWARGDRIQPLGLRGSRLLSDILSEAGIPPWARPRVPVVADEAGILWVVPLRRSHRGRLTPRTRRVLVIEARPCPRQDVVA